MKVKSIKSRFSEIFIVPMGDLHIGSKSFDKESREKLVGYIKYIKRNIFVGV